MVLLEMSRCCIPKVRIIALCYVMHDLFLGCDLGCNRVLNCYGIFCRIYIGWVQCVYADPISGLLLGLVIEKS